MKKLLLLFLPVLLLACSFLYYYNSKPAFDSRTAAAGKAKPVRWVDTHTKQTLYHVVIGDSLAKGYGSSQGGYAGIASKQLEAKLQKQVIVDNIAVNGLTTTGLISLLERPDVKEKLQKADIITISIGGNNLLRLNRNFGILEGLKMLDQEKKKFQADLEHILLTIRAENKDAVLVLSELYNPLQLEDSISSYASLFLDGWNKTIRTAADTYNPAIVLPVRKLIPNDAKELLYDGVHPNDAGYARIADAFVQSLLSYKL
ncbi:GDSL-type esterase/lipase family protein [Ectobacillus ponti]|uniref:GDSL-type esterase/lipase family protein n=1 Tax=Ectobacillus ponti TaxID=2961894 RepID=A0AA42BN10_9BACI|nr:GDSL-type esterase/lipase family protein [Ectobacillus ponti]MCP8966986.1 GDSL-type esterase/lipase family protein [Ectobacillus ponti]